MTNQPLFLRYNPAVGSVLHGASVSGDPAAARDRVVTQNCSGRPNRTSSVAERKLDGQQVCLQLGFIEETEANHKVYFTPESPVQQFCCICFIFRIPKDEN